mmetsp:Transcript_51653/g.116413  ORF Transcript_51653/g.116413 Transcript_51653/m.116413 type:complete len:94 (+) Transcript_51653:1546-1827(+)
MKLVLIRTEAKKWDEHCRSGSLSAERTDFMQSIAVEKDAAQQWSNPIAAKNRAEGFQQSTSCDWSNDGFHVISSAAQRSRYYWLFTCLHHQRK